MEEGTVPQILLVDDNHAELLIFRAVGEGFLDILFCPTGEDAIRRLTESDTGWHAILIDVNLPGVNGWSVADAVLASRHKGTPLLMWSNFVGAKDVDAAKNRGVEIAAKPEGPLEYESLVRRLVGMSACPTDR